MAKIFLFSPLPLKKSMAGPTIRIIEMAKVLSHNHEVFIVSDGISELNSEDFQCLSLQDPLIKNHFRKGDILITQRLTVRLALLCCHTQMKIILDAYDPSPFELLEYYKMEMVKDRSKKISSEIATLLFSFKMADGILCASEKQRELWLGFLLGLKIIKPEIYDRDPSFSSFIAVVPFGLSSAPPKKNGSGMRAKLGIDEKDKVLLWGGGIWNWFDPLTLIKAMEIIVSSRHDIKLVFMGVKSPDPTLPTMKMAHEAIQLSERLKMTDRTIFFYQEWVPYQERQNFLLDADVGLSTHFDHLETRFSFRTRLLDYIWAELPIIATEGDTFAEWIESHELGMVVPFKNPQVLASTILDLLNDRKKQISIKNNMRVFKEQFYWTQVMKPLEVMIDQLALQKRNRTFWQINKALVQLIASKVKEKGLLKSLKKIRHSGNLSGQMIKVLN